MKHLDLFSGIGGFTLAAKALGWETVQFVEKNEYCQKVLRHHFPDVPIHSDVKDFVGHEKKYDIITAGFPCQDLSLAGSRDGFKGTRSVLFYQAARIIAEAKPKGFCIENVGGTTHYLPYVVEELWEVGGYDVRWFTLSCAQLGGCHKRERFFLVGRKAVDRSADGIPWNTAGAGCNSKFNHFTQRYLQGEQNRGDAQGVSRWAQWFRGVVTYGAVMETAAKYANYRGTAKVPELRQYLQSEPELCDKHDGVPFWLAKSWRGLKDALMSREQAYQKFNDIAVDCEVYQHKEKIQALGNAVTPQQAFVALSCLSYWIFADE